MRQCDERYQERGLSVGDLVKCKHKAGTKLHPRWDGLFIIQDITDKNTYQLQTKDTSFEAYTTAKVSKDTSHLLVPKAPCGLLVLVFDKRTQQSNKNNKSKKTQKFSSKKKNTTPKVSTDNAICLPLYNKLTSQIFSIVTGVMSASKRVML